MCYRTYVKIALCNCCKTYVSFALSGLHCFYVVKLPGKRNANKSNYNDGLHKTEGLLSPQRDKVTVGVGFTELRVYFPHSVTK